jgi:hypothetical protein
MTTHLFKTTTNLLNLLAGHLKSYIPSRMAVAQVVLVTGANRGVSLTFSEHHSLLYFGVVHLLDVS